MQDLLAVTAGLHVLHTHLILLRSLQAILSHGQANFVILPVDHTAAGIEALGGLLSKEGAKLGKLPPGLHNATATYHGDGTYAPATANAALYVSPTCPLLFLTSP